MQLKSLTLANVRAFKQAEFTFQPGMNLIVGINGVGKSTVLDALCILLSQTLPKISQSRSKALQFEDSDVTTNQKFFVAKLNFEIGNIELSQSISRNDTTPTPKVVTPQAPNISIKANFNLRPHYSLELNTDENYDIGSLDRNILTGDPAEWLKLKKSQQQSLALYISSRRAFPDNTKSSKSPSGLASAFHDSLKHRELRLMELADWWLAQKDLVTEGHPNAQRHLDVLSQAITYFIDNCTNIQVKRETTNHLDKNGKTTQKSTTILTIDKAGIPFDFRQLSDGERGLLAIVLDLARRLSQANPNLEDPLQGQAVVLIDELDLHLHPQWQRSIVQKLTTTFPNCQFIATTHSPLIIGEVEPSGLILLSKEGDQLNVIQSGLQGFGLDSSWILRHLMNTDSRNLNTSQAKIDQIEDALEEGDLDLARQHLDEYKTIIHGNDDESIRLEASINNLEALADAVD